MVMSRATEVDALLQTAVAAGEVAGVVALATDDAGVHYAGTFGTRAQGGEAAMTLDTVVWMASMTKPVTSVAAMQLVEQGAVSLDEPLARLLPELGRIQVLDGFDAAGAPKLRPPRQPITLRRLLTHTAGFAYDTWDASMLRYLAATGLPSIGSCRKQALLAPLVFDPGERWEYGINLEWVGQLVERLSGQPLDAYLRDHIFAPLGMRDTGFILGPDQRQRLASVHRRQEDGSLTPIAFEVTQTPEFFMGGGGLYSTGPDYLRFLRMLLHGGELDGARVLRAETVAEMHRNHTGDLPAGVLTSYVPVMSHNVELLPGVPKGWALGHLINHADAPSGRRAGSLAWAGLANTYYWLDPTRRLTGVLLTQVLPFGDPTVISLFDQFERAICTASVPG